MAAPALVGTSASACLSGKGATAPSVSFSSITECFHRVHSKQQVNSPQLDVQEAARMEVSVSLQANASVPKDSRDQTAENRPAGQKRSLGRCVFPRAPTGGRAGGPERASVQQAFLGPPVRQRGREEGGGEGGGRGKGGERKRRKGKKGREAA